MADQSVGFPVAAGKRAWLAVLLAGVLVWFLAAGVTAITEDDILVPTLFMIGSFLVPVTVVTFALGRLDDCRLTANVILTGFLAAGTIGVVVSAVTEIYLLPTGSGPLGNALGFFGVGLIEEVSKGAVLVAVAWRVRERTVHGGMVLGATVGAGFAAFESTGYAF
ncbi:MAG: PrsW family glutamic-type intramembrane protease [Kribbellaceae bacterium]